MSASGSRFVSGALVRWRALGSFLASSFIFAWFSGLADIVTAFVTAPATAIGRFFASISAFLGLIFSRPAEALAVAWSAAAAFVADLGVVAFIAGVAMVVLFFPFVNWLTEKWKVMVFDA
jgi:hypothetical protein